MASAPLLGTDHDSARNFAATVPMMALPLALAVGALTRPLFGEQDEDACVAAAQPTPGRHWAPALIGAGIVAAALFGTPVAAAVVENPPVAEHRCPDGTWAHAFVGGVTLRIFDDGPGTENRLHQLERSVLQKVAPLGWRLGPATAPGTAASAMAGRASAGVDGTTMLSAITLHGDDRIAIVNGEVDAPGRSVLYLCGREETDVVSVALSNVFWPKPVTFAFFTGSPLP